MGSEILDDTVDKPVMELIFLKKNKVITMEAKLQLSTDSDIIMIDPQHLFQRLVLAGTANGNMDNVFKQELCSYPPALFETTNSLLSADKPVLDNLMWKWASDQQFKA